MNPIIVIACWGRLPLLEINLRMLLAQGAQVVVTVSLNQDANFIKGLKLKNVHMVTVANNPLGKKWQAGVNKARELGADPLIIVGSDDFLSANFVSKACNLSRYKDFIFFDHFFIHAPESGQNFYIKYNMERWDKPPIGSGRIYSKLLLERRNWGIFDPEADIHLDNYAWENKHHDDQLMCDPNGINVLAVKGSWECMNPMDKILLSDTIYWEEEKNIDQHFGYGKTVKDIFKDL